MYDFGLSSDQFWDLTPPQFEALSERHDTRNERDEFYAGLVASVIANVNRDAEKRPEAFQPKDFMPSQRGSEEEAAPIAGEMSPDQILAHLKAAFPPQEAHGG